jgi:hypothetical protein
MAAAGDTAEAESSFANAEASELEAAAKAQLVAAYGLETGAAEQALIMT